MLLNHFGDVGLAVVVWPMHHSGLHAVFVEEIGRAACAIDVVPLLLQLLDGIEERHLALQRTRRNQDVFLRDFVADGEHRFEDCLVIILTQTTNFASGSHLDAEGRVGLCKTCKRELRSLDANIFEVEESFGGRRYFQSQHNVGGVFYEVAFQHLRYKWERARCTEIEFDDLHVVVLGEELHIERS